MLVLSQIDFENERIFNIEENLFNCIKNNTEAELNIELLLKHGGNLGSAQLEELLLEFGIENPLTVIRNNDIFIEYIMKKSQIDKIRAKEIINRNNGRDSNLFGELNELLEQRNRVAHGWIVEDRKSYTYI